MLTEIPHPNFGITSSRDHWVPQLFDVRYQEDFGMYGLMDTMFEIFVTGYLNPIAEAGTSECSE